MTRKNRRQRRSGLQLESGGWASRKTAHRRKSNSAQDLIEQSVDPRPGNERLGRIGDRTYRFVEFPAEDYATEMLLNGGRAARSATDEDAQQVHSLLEPDEVTQVFHDTAYEWELVEEGGNAWRASAWRPPGIRCDLRADMVPRGVVLGGNVLGGNVMGGDVETGVEVSAVAASWTDDLSESSRLAIAEFLAVAHARIRFARFVMNIESQVISIVSFACTAHLGVQLSAACDAVVTSYVACESQIAALLNEQVATTYLTTRKSVSSTK